MVLFCNANNYRDGLPETQGRPFCSLESFAFTTVRNVQNYSFFGFVTGDDHIIARLKTIVATENHFASGINSRRGRITRVQIHF